MSHHTKRDARRRSRADRRTCRACSGSPSSPRRSTVDRSVHLEPSNSSNRGAPVASPIPLTPRPLGRGAGGSTLGGPFRRRRRPMKRWVDAWVNRGWRPACRRVGGRRRVGWRWARRRGSAWSGSAGRRGWRKALLGVGHGSSSFLGPCGVPSAEGWGGCCAGGAEGAIKISEPA